MCIFKRLAVLALLIPSLILSGCAKNGESKKYSFSDADYPVNAADMAVMGDIICYIDGGNVYSVDGSELYAGNAGFIAASCDTLYIYDGGSILAKEGDIRLLCAAPDNITSLVYAENTLCWTYTDEKARPKIGVYNLKNGDSISIAPLFDGECKALPCEGSKLLIECHDISGEMELYDFDSTTMKTGGFLMKEQNYISAYNDADGCVYTLDGSVGANHMRKYPLDGGESVSLVPCDALSQNVGQLIFRGGFAIIRRQNGSVAVRSVFTSPDAATTVRAIIPPENADIGHKLETAAYILKRDRDIILEYSVLDYDKFRLKTLAGDDDYDLFYATTGTYGTLTTLDYKIYEPLEGYSQIAEFTGGFFDDVTAFCTRDGHIFGIPCYFGTVNIFMEYNSALADELGIEPPDAGWTLSDFYALAVEAREKGAYIAVSPPLSLWDYMWEYMDAFGSGTLNDDGSALREYLTITKKLYSEDLMYGGTYSEARKAVENGTLKLLFTGGASGIVWNKTAACLQPTFTGERIYGGDAGFLCINANSRNKNAAATVIGELFDTDNELFTDPSNDFLLYKDMSVYRISIRPSNYEAIKDSDPALLEDIMARAEEAAKGKYKNDLVNMDEATRRNFQLYLDCLKHLRLSRSYTEQWLDYAAGQEEKYYADEQDLDYTVKLILDRARMVMDE